MIVDDNDYNLYALQRMLTRRGYEVLTAYNGVECLDRVIQQVAESQKCSLNDCKTFRMIFMDVDMPIMNGLQATTALKVKEANGDIPVIPIVGCSAFDSKQDIIEGLKAGMSDYIMKPVLDSNLDKILEKFKF
eukprot:TRINITY_DN20473_c0_g1_i2.p1 TRINITY_DN20473_c0_g1~~TRINITY_DN20473_c0_g1_i2.p1  ORF type:complete len:133 (+),score=26.36 TRINITY_DN20473_c0_g1_i2:266-664(+)